MKNRFVGVRPFHTHFEIAHHIIADFHVLHQNYRY